MSENVFRQKSLDRIQSPESLNDYIKVASPGIWLLMAAALALLAGILIWGIVTTVDSGVKVTAFVHNGECLAYTETAEDIAEGAEAVIGGVSGTVASCDGNVCVIDIALEDGVYEGKILSESVKPISFVVN